jgi:type I restriction enzyme S subunit
MKAQNLKNAILQLAVQGKLVPQYSSEAEINLSKLKLKATDEITFDIPTTWKSAHIECVCNPIPSKRYQILESEVLKSGQYPVISQSKEYSIGYTDMDEKVFHLKSPIIAFGDHTTEVKYITFDFVIGADGVKLFEPKQDILFPLFFFYVLQYYTIGLNKLGGYSRHYKFIKNKPIPLPPLAEQKRIVAKLDELLGIIDG